MNTKNAISEQEKVIEEFRKFFIPAERINGESIVDYSDLLNVAHSTAGIIGNNYDTLDLFPEIRIALGLISGFIISPNGGNEGVSKKYHILDTKLNQGLLSKCEKTIQSFINKEMSDIDLYNEIWSIRVTDGAVARLVLNRGELINFLKKIKSNSSDVITMSKDPISGFKQNPLIDDVITLSVTDKIKLPDNKNSTSITLFQDVQDDVIKNWGLNILSDPIIAGLNYMEMEERATLLSKSTSPGRDGVLSSEIISKIDELVNARQDNSLAINGLNHGIHVPKGDKEGGHIYIRLPASSIVPIINKSDLNKPKAFMVVLDELYSPYDVTNFRGNTNYLEKIINNRIQGNNIDKSDGLKVKILNNMPGLYREVIRRHIKDRLYEIMGSKNIDVELPNDVLEVLFNRGLSAKKANILFLTTEQLSYQALEYRKNGTGASLLERVNLLLSFRSVVFLHNIHTSMRNAIPRKTVKYIMPDSVKDPVKAGKDFINITNSKNAGLLPTGDMNLRALMQNMANQGVTYILEHINFPKIEISYEESTTAIPVNTELENMLMERMIAALNIKPSMITSRAAFATELKQGENDINRMISDNQYKFIESHSKFVQMVLSNNMYLIKKLEDIIRADKAQVFNAIPKNVRMGLDSNILTEDEVIRYVVYHMIIANTKLVLPSLEKANNDPLKESYINFKTVVDEMFAEFLDNGAAIPSSITERYGSDLDGMVYLFKLGLSLDWWDKNGFMNGAVLDTFTTNEDGLSENPILNKAHMFFHNLALSYQNAEKQRLDIESNEKAANVKNDKKVQKLKEKLGDKEDRKDIDTTGSGDIDQTIEESSDKSKDDNDDDIDQTIEESSDKSKEDNDDDNPIDNKAGVKKDSDTDI